MLIKYVQGFIKYRALLFEFVERDIKTRYRRSVLGLLWTLLNPLMTMIVMTIIFSTLFKSAITNFPVYLLSGYTIFNYFSESTSNALTSIIAGGALIKKIYIPKYLFPLSKIVSTLVNLVASFLALILVMLATGVTINASILLLVFPLVYVSLFALGVGLIMSSLAVFFRDMIHLYGVLLTLWLYMTPLFYPLEILPPATLRVVQLNPLTAIVEYTRCITMYGVVPPPILNVICVIPGLVACMIGLTLFYHKQDRFILYI